MVVKMDVFVKYKLLNFGNGLIKPPEIFEGGKIWQMGQSIKDSIFLGKIKYAEGMKLPDGVITIVDKGEVSNHDDEVKSLKLKQLKQKAFAEKCDPLFVQAVREKELGDDSKWKKYLIECEKIKAMTLENV